MVREHTSTVAAVAATYLPKRNYGAITTTIKHAIKHTIELKTKWAVPKRRHALDAGLCVCAHPAAAT